mgnify:CR=1 FL=1
MTNKMYQFLKATRGNWHNSIGFSLVTSVVCRMGRDAGFDGFSRGSLMQWLRKAALGNSFPGKQCAILRTGHRQLPNWPSCDAYVSAHRKDRRPMGTLANSELRHKRILADNPVHNGEMHFHKFFLFCRQTDFLFHKYHLAFMLPVFGLGWQVPGTGR